MLEENKPEEIYVYKNLNEVPERWRKLKGARLSVEQVNEICKRAYELGEEREIEGETIFQWNRAAAQDEFMKAHTIVGDIWISGGKINVSAN